MTHPDSTVTDSGFIALVGGDSSVIGFLSACNLKTYQLKIFKSSVELINIWNKEKLNIVAIVSQSEILGPGGISLLETLKNSEVPVLLICRQINDGIAKIALRSGIAEVFITPLQREKFELRLFFLIKYWKVLQHKKQKLSLVPYKIPLIKRTFDILVAGMALLLLSPLLLFIILLIKLESKGPVFYYSLRVGTGYKIFKFYKLRSMYTNADKRLKDLRHLNQYAGDQKTEMENTDTSADEMLLCDECIAAGKKCQFLLYADNVNWCEKEHIYNKKYKDGSTFFKMKDDPRITKMGKFIRNTSMDELPQLWNVIIGDMSIVGNRPLPLYEAEKLTTDKYALRFIAPAGITGLWQVEKRGKKGEMSEEERLMLDNSYAKNHSFFNDIKLILKTIPALFQKENV